MTRRRAPGAPSRWRLLPALLLLLLAGLLVALALFDVQGLEVHDPRVAIAPSPVFDAALPRVMRFRPDDADAAWGLVLAADAGVPRRVLDLTSLHPQLGSSLESFLDADGLALAEAALAAVAAGEHAEWIVELPAEELAARVLPPVDVTLADLANENRFVVGVGFNYPSHREETASDVERVVFAKACEPTGAYRPVSMAAAGFEPEGSHLIDYEAELAFVLLENLDLERLPATPEELDERVAYMVANDLSDRAPVIVDGLPAFTAAKSHPGFLPLGPWMVHGRHLPLAGGAVSLDVALAVEEGGGRHHGRQSGSTGRWIRDPLEVLQMLAELHRESVRADRGGSPRRVAPAEHSILPRGSLVLTGTPAGTAVEAPRGLDRLRLLLLGRFSLRGAREAFLEHCLAHRDEMGFLEPGDRVETAIEHLGRQDWRIVP